MNQILNNQQKELINECRIFCDGGSRGNPGPGACSFVAKNNQDRIICQKGKFLGKTTNNIAEYNGVLLALNWLKSNAKYEFKKISFYLDSNLVVSQLNGVFKVKDSTLRELYFQIKVLENQINTPLTYGHIPREQNFDADLLVNQVLDSPI